MAKPQGSREIIECMRVPGYACVDHAICEETGCPWQQEMTRMACDALEREDVTDTQRAAK
jgi:hypothetical protein